MSDNICPMCKNNNSLVSHYIKEINDYILKCSDCLCIFCVSKDMEPGDMIGISRYKE